MPEPPPTVQTAAPVDIDLAGKVALVTGGTRGLGREMVFALARHGADVVVVSRKADACRAAADQVTSETGRGAFGYPCHVGHWDQIDALVEAAYARFGRIDILVNNAGMSPLYDSVENITEDLWDNVVDVNLKGPFRLTALIGRRMERGGGGSIVNISSIASIRPSPEYIPYSAAKAGLNAITIAFAHTFGPTVRVNCIVCGTFRTDMSKAWDIDAVTERLRRTSALGRIAEAKEVVGAMLYFASDLASYTTGALLRVDGGRV